MNRINIVVLTKVNGYNMGEEANIWFVAQWRAQRSGFLNLLSGYPLYLLGETNFQSWFFNVLQFFFPKDKDIMFWIFWWEGLRLLCSVEVPVGLGPEALVLVLLQLFTYLSVTLGTWRERLEAGSCDLWVSFLLRFVDLCPATLWIFLQKYHWLNCFSWCLAH